MRLHDVVLPLYISGEAFLHSQECLLHLYNLDCLQEDDRQGSLILAIEAQHLITHTIRHHHTMHLRYHVVCRLRAPGLITA